MFGRILVLAYGVVCYVLFLGVFLYAIAFVGDWFSQDWFSRFVSSATGGFVGDWIVPKSIDRGQPDNFIAKSVSESEWAKEWFDTPLSKGVAPLLVDILLLSLFAVQHSGMARPGFKRWWTSIVPQPIERSTYVLMTSVVLFILYWQWQPIPEPLWQIQSPIATNVIDAIAGIGWLIVLLSTFLINHFSLFGLQQTYYFFSGRELPDAKFHTPLFYRYVRHPLMLGFLIAFWATPKMSLGHLLFSVMTTGYILMAIQLEERDLVRFHGEEYERYRELTSMILPIPGRRVD